MKRRQVGLSVSPKRAWLESRMTPRAGNETARSVQLIGVGLSEVFGKTWSRCRVGSVVRQGGVWVFRGQRLGLHFLDHVDRGTRPVDEPVGGGVLFRDRSGDQDRGKDHPVGDSVAGLVSETGEETAKIR